MNSLREVAFSAVVRVANQNTWQPFENNTLLVIDRCGRLAYQQHLAAGDLDFSYLQFAIMNAREDLPCGLCPSEIQVTERSPADLVGPSLSEINLVYKPSLTPSRIPSNSPNQPATSAGGSSAPSSRKRRMSEEIEPKRKRKRKSKKQRRNEKKQRNKRRRKGSKLPVVHESFVQPIEMSSIVIPSDVTGCRCKGLGESEERLEDDWIPSETEDCPCSVCPPEADAERPAIEIQVVYPNMEETFAEVLAQSQGGDKNTILIVTDDAPDDGGSLNTEVGEILDYIRNTDRQPQPAGEVHPPEDEQDVFLMMTDDDPDNGGSLNTDSIMHVLDYIHKTDKQPQSGVDDDQVTVLMVLDPEDTDNFVDSREENRDVTSGADKDVEPTVPSVVDIVWPRDKKPSKVKNDKEQNPFEIVADITTIEHDVDGDLVKDKFNREVDFVMTGTDMNDVNLVLDRDEIDKKIREEEEDMSQTGLDLTILADNELDSETVPLGIDVVVDNPEENETTGQRLGTEDGINRSEQVEEDVWTDLDEEETYQIYGKKKIDKFSNKKYKSSSDMKSDRMWKKYKKEQDLEESASGQDDLVENVAPNYPARGIENTDAEDDYNRLVVRTHVTLSPTLYDPDSSSESHDPDERLVVYRSTEDAVDDRTALLHSKVMPWMNRKL